MIQRRIFSAFTAAFLVWMLLAIALPIEMARAQNPTPAPTPTLTLTEDCVVNGIKQCGGRVVREYGLLTFVLAGIVIAAIVFIARAFWKGASKPVAEKIENSGARLVTRDDMLTRYLRAVEGDYLKFKFRGLDERSKGIFTPELDKAFVSLLLASEAEPETRLRPEKGAEEVARALSRAHVQPISLAHALEHAPRLAIVGAAGSGKSTLLQWAGLAMTRARLEERAASEEQRAFVKNAGGKLVPILLPLRAFADDFVAQKIKPNASALLAFFTKYVNEKHPTLDLESSFFEKQLRGNGMLVMFDGVDEVLPQDRAAVRAAMEGLVSEFARNEKNRYLVTSRTYAYFGGAQVSGFRECQVQNLDETQRNTLIASWCLAAYPNADEAKSSARDLIQRLDTADERVRVLAVTPLMTTIFALVHYDRNKELPKQRAELYEHAVRILLTEPYKDDTPRLDWEERRNRLAAIAFEMHAVNVEELPEDDLAQLCWRAFGAEEKSARKATQDFFRAVADRGGLLEEVNGKYGFFTHRTFREFLAGRFLAEEKSADEQAKFLRERLNNDQWFEATRLAAGYLAIAGERRANDFILRLAELGDTDAAHAQAMTLAGLALSDLPLARIAPETHPKISRALLDLVEANPPLVEPRLRRSAGLALGEIGDPRFAPFLVGEGQGVRFPALVTIRAGEFLMGTSDAEADALKQQDAETWDDEKPQRRVYVSEFEIGKYPITNQEFRAFWHADGYADETLWSADGWKWRKGLLDFEPFLSIYSEDLRKSVREWLKNRPVEKRSEPFFWRDPKWNAPNLPVVGVTWFEAEAYCNWLTRMANQGDRETGKQVVWRLPTEAEWERAARGPENFLWSWGNTWDARKCNSSESKFEATTPAGMYPDGTWRDEQGNVGPLDMMGNVWEWCGDWYQDDLYETRAQETTRDPQGPVSGNARVIRGGSWDDARGDCRAAYRHWNGPMNFNPNVGFRVVVVPIPRS